MVEHDVVQPLSSMICPRIVLPMCKPLPNQKIIKTLSISFGMTKCSTMQAELMPHLENIYKPLHLLSPYYHPAFTIFNPIPP
jgi:hypothetical protein